MEYNSKTESSSEILDNPMYDLPPLIESEEYKNLRKLLKRLRNPLNLGCFYLK
jgi:hypothetical protein